VSDLPGPHIQPETPDERNDHLREAFQMLLEDGDPGRQTEFVRATPAPVQ